MQIIVDHTVNAIVTHINRKPTNKYTDVMLHLYTALLWLPKCQTVSVNICLTKLKKTPEVWNIAAKIIVRTEENT